MGWICYDISASDSTDFVISEEKMKKFEEKYKDIINIFKGKLFSLNDSGTYDLLEGNMEIASRNILDDNHGPNWDKALAMFFGNDSEADGVAFSLGISGFKDEFYADLMMLSEDMQYVEWFITVTGGFQGYYEGSLSLSPQGLVGGFDFESGLEECGECKGTGYAVDEETECEECEGIGSVDAW